VRAYRLPGNTDGDGPFPRGRRHAQLAGVPVQPVPLGTGSLRKGSPNGRLTSGAAVEGVLAGAAVQDVVAVAALERVVAGAADQNVVAGAAVCSELIALAARPEACTTSSPACV